MSKQPAHPMQCYAVTNHQGKESYPDEGSEVFKVNGAGYLTFHPNVVARCGTAVGMSVDCGWSKYGYSGWVMGVEEVRRLRNLLDVWLTEKAADCR